METNSLGEAIRKLTALKEEHRPIFAQVAGDPGMSPQTRVVLLEHLREEEDEVLAHIASLAQGGGAEGGAVPASSGFPALSVGSLRPPQTSAPNTLAGSVGSLRSR